MIIKLGLQMNHFQIKLLMQSIKLKIFTDLKHIVCADRYEFFVSSYLINLSFNNCYTH